jgi:antitoxin component of RelBE/YafQ-DinJ toxin-antitoxin module
LTDVIKKTRIDLANQGGSGMQLTVRIPDEYKKKVAVVTQKLGLKRSDIVRLALKQFIEENLKADQRTPFQKVSHLLGIAESGIKDLGQRHRDYLIKKVQKAA